MRPYPTPTRSGRPSSRGLALALATGLLLLAAGAAAAPPRRGAPVPAPVPPDPVEDAARRHFELGQKAFNEDGDFGVAIEEYRKAYRLKPHPAGLFNIAQAHEKLQQYTAAVAWFERYLKDHGADPRTRTFVEKRLRWLRNLPARIQVDCVPQATALLIDPDGIVEQAETPKLFTVKAGRYTLQVVRPGYVPQERRIVVDLGQTYYHQFTLHAQQELVRVRPDPTAARVFLDDKLVGTGFFADRVAVGQHRLLVEYGQYEPYTSEFELKPGHRLEVDVALKPPPPVSRPEFVAAMAVYGALAVPFGLHASGAIKASDSYLLVSTGLGGAGLFALGGFYLTPRGIRQANASLLTAGATWGGMEGLALAMLESGGGDARLTTGLALGGSLVGLGTALLLIRPLQPTPGQSAMLNSGGLWGTALGVGLGYAMRGNKEDVNLTLLIGLNVGLITSGILINHVEVSRTRMFLIDLGAMAGSATGFALAFATFGTDPLKSDAGTARLARGALIGGAAGVVAAALLTRRWDGSPRTITRDSLVSFEGTRLELGVPRPALSLGPREDGAGRDTRFTLQLASGKF